MLPPQALIVAVLHLEAGPDLRHLAVALLEAHLHLDPPVLAPVGHPAVITARAEREQGLGKSLENPQKGRNAVPLLDQPRYTLAS